MSRIPSRDHEKPIPPRGARWYSVPAGARSDTCRGLSLGGTCNQRIYWTRTPAGFMPVDCDVAGGKRPSEARTADQGDLFTTLTPVFDGKGILHNAVCPDAKIFEKTTVLPIHRGQRAS